LALPVTVIIPAYNAANTIRRSLDSVLAQTTPAAEVFVVDDGSPDGKQLIAEVASFGPTVTLLRTRHGSASNARNFGIDRVRRVIGVEAAKNGFCDFTRQRK
jgi:glycosyltransferase involved in cell wall biosynthesis